MVRVAKAYPYYDFSYKENVATIRRYLEAEAPNVHPVGRNGMHKYNNQDHSMYTAMLTVENIFGASHDIWSVNVEEEYHEGGAGPAGPRTRPRDRSRRADPPVPGARAGPNGARRRGPRAQPVQPDR